MIVSFFGTQSKCSDTTDYLFVTFLIVYFFVHFRANVLQIFEVRPNLNIAKTNFTTEHTLQYTPYWLG